MPTYRPKCGLCTHHISAHSWVPESDPHYTEASHHPCKVPGCDCQLGARTNPGYVCDITGCPHPREWARVFDHGFLMQVCSKHLVDAVTLPGRPERTARPVPGTAWIDLKELRRMHREGKAKGDGTQG